MNKFLEVEFSVMSGCSFLGFFYNLFHCLCEFKFQGSRCLSTGLDADVIFGTEESVCLFGPCTNLKGLYIQDVYSFYVLKPLAVTHYLSFFKYGKWKKWQRNVLHEKLFNAITVDAMRPFLWIACVFYSKRQRKSPQVLGILIEYKKQIIQGHHASSLLQSHITSDVFYWTGIWHFAGHWRKIYKLYFYEVI